MREREREREREVEVDLGFRERKGAVEKQPWQEEREMEETKKNTTQQREGHFRNFTKKVQFWTAIHEKDHFVTMLKVQGLIWHEKKKKFKNQNLT